jgi:hypothetical protein
MLSSNILPYGHHCTDYHLNYPLARSFHYKGQMVVHLVTQTILVAMNTKRKVQRLVSITGWSTREKRTIKRSNSPVKGVLQKRMGRLEHLNTIESGSFLQV